MIELITDLAKSAVGPFIGALSVVALDGSTHIPIGTAILCVGAVAGGVWQIARLYQRVFDTLKALSDGQKEMRIEVGHIKEDLGSRPCATRGDCTINYKPESNQV
jgi:hypothetical protein